MAQLTIDDAPGAEIPDPDDPTPTPRGRRRLVWRVLIGLAVAVVVIVLAGVGWFFFGRDGATERSTDAALDDFRQSGAAGSEAEGRPAVGVYDAVASGSEDIGLPGLTESFGPGAPVTVTHGAGGCFTYRVDLNTNHWRSWTFCPEGEATFALTVADSSTVRDVPGLDVDSLTTYTCETPVPYLWPEAAVGDRREGSCTGVSDTIDGITGDAGMVEVLGFETMTVGGEEVDVVHLRSTDTFTDAQVGTEVDEWWIDVATGLPVKLVIDADLTSSAGDYVEKATLELTSLVPTT
jgi:hypothetical protein